MQFRTYIHPNRILRLAESCGLERIWECPLNKASGLEIEFGCELVRRRLPFTFNRESFELAPAAQTDYATYQASIYTPDFVIRKDGRTIAVEIKGYKDPATNFRYKAIDLKLSSLGIEFWILRLNRTTKEWVAYNRQTQLPFFRAVGLEVGLFDV